MGLFSVAFCTDIKYFSLSSNSLFWEKKQSTAHSQTRGEKSSGHQKQSEDKSDMLRDPVQEIQEIQALQCNIFAVKLVWSLYLVMLGNGHVILGILKHQEQ